MTLLSIVQDAADEIGWDRPTSVVGNADARQFLRLLNREGEVLSKWPWQALVKEHTFTLSTADQDYALPSDYRSMLPSTQWNRDNKRRIIWITSEEWQFFKGWTTVNGLNLRARLRNNQFEFEQTITSSDNGKTIAFEYISKNWTLDSASNAQQKFAADDDTAVLDEELLTMGLVWRFRKAKGLDFATELAEYQAEVQRMKAQDKVARKLNLSNSLKTSLGVNTQEGDYPSV